MNTATFIFDEVIEQQRASGNLWLDLFDTSNLSMGVYTILLARTTESHTIYMTEARRISAFDARAN